MNLCRFTMAKILKYEDEQMQQALVAVKQNNVSIKAAAKQFNVPKTTLYYKVKGKYPEIRHMGPRTNLLEEEEKIIINWMFKSADGGFPITKSQLLDSIEMYIKKLNRSTSFKDGRPGAKWFKLFMKRHPEVSPRMTQNLGKARASVTEESLKKWFDEVKAELKENLDVLEDASRVFNADETAIFLAPKGEKALVRKGEKAVYSFISNDEKECITCLIGCNALGQLMPPMAVFKYERIPSSIINELPDHWSFGRTESGWMTSSTFFEYVANIFHPWLLEKNIKLPIVLFVDGHSSHLTYSLSEFCSENGIHLVALHPNATHIIQPMDVAAFRPLKHIWKQAVHSYKIKNAGAKLKRENFAPLVDAVLQQLKPESLMNGFRSSGIFPFNKNAINYDKYFKNNKVKQTGQESTISKEMLRIHFKFIQSRIGIDMVKKFENHSPENGDTSLYLLWKQLKEECNMETNTEVTDTEVYSIEEVEQSTEINSLQETTPEDLENSSTVRDLENAEINISQTTPPAKKLEQNGISGQTKYPESSQQNLLGNNIFENVASTSKRVSPSKDNETCRPYTKDNQMPSPFKDVFILPQNNVKNVKKRVLREPMPSVISGEKGKKYFKNKEEERERLEREKCERKQKREETKMVKLQENEEKKRKLEEKRQIKINQTLEKQKNKRKRVDVTSDESSDSSIEMLVESEGEGDNWDQPLSENSEGVEETIVAENPLEEEDFVIIIYEGRYYPGQIKQINSNNKSYLVKTMKQSGFNFRWPEKEDILWYSQEEVISKIGKPRLINSRGSYYVHEMNIYME